jgi:hypothetical protein
VRNITGTAATFPGVTAFDRGVFALPEFSPAIGRGLVIGLGAVSAVGIMAGAVTLTAAWIVGVVFAANPHYKARTPVAMDTAALILPHGSLAGAENLSGLAGFSSDTADASDTASRASSAPRLAEEHSVKVAAALAPASASVPLPSDRPFERSNDVPLPLPRVSRAPQRQPRREVTLASEEPASPQVTASLGAPHESFDLFQKDSLSRQARDNPAKAALPQTVAAPAPAASTSLNSLSRRTVPPPPRGNLAKPALTQVAEAAADPQPATAPAPFNLFQKRVEPPPTRGSPVSLPAPGSRTAVYDIAAHTVYLPNGLRLEAHSGMGRWLDDPHYVNEKARGPTPPNVYDLVLRGELFHGVQAIRLNPVDDGKMFGRDGILAHTYMLGPTGQSFGCVSFKNYPEFLQAFLKGDVNRLVVVPHLETRVSSNERARGGHDDRYALANR